VSTRIYDFPLSVSLDLVSAALVNLRAAAGILVAELLQPNAATAKQKVVGAVN
jgi:hypothetical protein